MNNLKEQIFTKYYEKMPSNHMLDKTTFSNAHNKLISDYKKDGLFEKFQYDKKTWITMSVDYTINTQNNYYFLYNTFLRSLTLTLPQFPKIDQTIEIRDFASSWNRNNLIINSNGNRILSKIEDLICDVKDQYVLLKYINKEIGWNVYYKQNIFSHI